MSRICKEWVNFVENVSNLLKKVKKKSKCVKSVKNVSNLLDFKNNFICIINNNEYSFMIKH